MQRFRINRLASRLSLLGIGALFGATVSTSIMIGNIRRTEQKEEAAAQRRKQEKEEEEEEERREETEKSVDMLQLLRSGTYLQERYGLPGAEGDQALQHYKEFVSHVDYARKIPHWVAVTLTADLLNKGKSRVKRDKMANRALSKFSNSNEQTPQLFQCDNSDYWKSGWDRGHITAAADHPLDQEALNETFYLTSNIVPQNPVNNRAYWYRIEHWTRSLTKKYSNVHVISGPLFIASPKVMLDEEPGANAENGNGSIPEEQEIVSLVEKKVHPTVKMMQYPVIGKNEVHVPTHLFRVVLCENQSKEVHDENVNAEERQQHNNIPSPLSVAAFILPNAPIDHNIPLTHFQVPLEEVERRSGFQFFQKLKDKKTQSVPAERVGDLCSTSQSICQLVSQKTVDMWNYSKRLRGAKSKEELEDLWHRMADLSPDKWATEVYHQKLKSFDDDKIIERTSI